MLCKSSCSWPTDRLEPQHTPSYQKVQYAMTTHSKLLIRNWNNCLGCQACTHACHNCRGRNKGGRYGTEMSVLEKAWPPYNRRRIRQSLTEIPFNVSIVNGIPVILDVQEYVEVRKQRNLTTSHTMHPSTHSQHPIQCTPAHIKNVPYNAPQHTYLTATLVSTGTQRSIPWIVVVQSMHLINGMATASTSIP